MSRQNSPPPSKAAAQPQSMDDILAQIRQLVSEETSSPSPPEPAPPVGPEAGGAMPQPFGAPSALEPPRSVQQPEPSAVRASDEAMRAPADTRSPSTRGSDLPPAGGPQETGVSLDGRAASADIKAFEREFQSSSKGQPGGFGEARNALPLPTPSPGLDSSRLATGAPQPAANEAPMTAGGALERLRSSLAHGEVGAASPIPADAPPTPKDAPVKDKAPEEPVVKSAPTIVDEAPDGTANGPRGDSIPDVAASGSRTISASAAAETTLEREASNESNVSQVSPSQVDDSSSASEAAVKTGSGAQPVLEALVADALRPILREWLDANLDRVVREAVADELKRRRSDGDDRS